MVAQIYADDPESRLVLPRAVIAYAECWDDDERRRGKGCRMYVPHMANWLEGGSWHHIGNDRAQSGGRMTEAERIYESIKQARRN
jgi:hypothetical protein